MEQSTFGYEPLPLLQGPCIRLLEVHQARDHESVTCTLNIWSIQELPAFRAMSYTWGDPSPTAPIVVNGTRLNVRKNCEYALRQIRRQGAPNFCWVDAICIDQHNVEEKSRQVQIMGDIFSKATAVMACLGEHADGSEQLADFLKKKQRPLLLACSEILRYPSYAVPQWGFRLRRSLLRWLLFDPAIRDELPRICKSLVHLVDRPYFKRLWIVQELYMAKQVIFCCGPDVLDSHCLYGLYYLLQCNNGPLTSPMHFLLRGYTMNFDFDSSTAVPRWMDKIIFPRQHEELRDGLAALRRLAHLHPYMNQLRCATSAKPVQRDLAHVLALSQNLGCENVKDRYYGVLALLYQWQIRGVYPDYNISNYDLALSIFATHRIVEKDTAGASSRYLLPIIECLKLREGDENMARAIALRQSTSLPNNSLHSVSCSKSPGLKQGWRGWQLVQDRRSWVLDLPRSATRGKRRIDGLRRWKMDIPKRWKSDLSEIKNHQMTISNINDNNPDLLVCPEARLGDWVIAPPAYYYGFNWFLVIRDQHPDSFVFVGCGLGRLRDLIVDFFKFEPMFWVSFDAEDLLVLAAQFFDLEHFSQLPEPQVVNLLQTRVCGSPGSSYATKILQ